MRGQDRGYGASAMTDARFADPRDYFRTPEWRTRTDQVRARAAGICERCLLWPVRNVHHVTYVRFGREDLSDLLGLCRRCHRFIHHLTTDDPMPAWAPAYGPILRQTRGLLQEPEPIKRPGLEQMLGHFQGQFSGSPADAWLRWAGIPHEVTDAFGVGYADPSDWPGRRRSSTGWLVVAQHRPRGDVVGLMGEGLPRAGRAVEAGSWRDTVGFPSGQAGPVSATRSRSPLLCASLSDALVMSAAGSAEALCLARAGEPRWVWLVDTVELRCAFEPTPTHVHTRAAALGKQLRYAVPPRGFPTFASAWVSGRDDQVRAAIRHLSLPDPDAWEADT